MSLKLSAKAPESKREKLVSQTPKPDFSQSSSLPINQMLQLQRTIGNQAVQRMFNSGLLISKMVQRQVNDEGKEINTRFHEEDRILRKQSDGGEPVEASDNISGEPKGPYLDLQIACLVMDKELCNLPGGIPDEEDMLTYGEECKQDTNYAGPHLRLEDLFCDQPGLAIAKSLAKSYPGWRNQLPDCPCTAKEADSNTKAWKISNFFISTYHPGAANCYRTVKEYNTAKGTSHGQQCCYDKSGALITKGQEGAGTPDVWTPFWNHQNIDVYPWKRLGWKTYNKYWVPNSGNNCGTKQQSSGGTEQNDKCIQKSPHDGNNIHYLHRQSYSELPRDKTNKDNSGAQTQSNNFSQPINSPLAHILHMHKTIGNQAVQRLCESGVIQAKLKIGQPNDIYEQEADRMADEMMRISDFELPYQLIAEGTMPTVQKQVEEEEAGAGAAFLSTALAGLRRVRLPSPSLGEMALWEERRRREQRLRAMAERHLLSQVTTEVLEPRHPATLREEMSPDFHRELRSVMSESDIERLAVLPLFTVEAFMARVQALLDITLIDGSETREEMEERIEERVRSMMTEPRSEGESTPPSLSLIDLPEWLSLYSEGMVGFHVTINPAPESPLAARLTSHFRGRGLPMNRELLSELFHNREAGIASLETLLRRILPTEFGEDIPGIATYIADELMDAALEAYVQAERLTPAERWEERDARIRQVFGESESTELGPIQDLIDGLLDAGVSLTVHF